MAKYRASLSKGRTGWCVIFSHPMCKSPNGRQQLRVRRGLGTRDEKEAETLVSELNEILSDPDYWNPTSKERAEARFEPRIVAAFYDHIAAEKWDAWSDREAVIRLPTKEDGYAVAQLVGTTGAGKTTVVRQLLGTDPKRERFPSISAAKTTICDLELVLADGNFRAAVSFIPRDQVRQYITECTVAAVSAHVESNQREAARRFMEHSEQRFRLGYILGHITPPSSRSHELEDDDGEESPVEQDEVGAEAQRRHSERLQEFLERIEELALRSKEKVAKELKIDLASASSQDRDVLQEHVEDQLIQDDGFHSLVDEILDEVEARFELVETGALERGRDGWPRLWTIESEDRDGFIRAVNRFSSNYAPNFGQLLTPLVEGIRVAGPFSPRWLGGQSTPRVVLLDGQGIGHTADSTSSISTAVTNRFQIADMILLVDNAAQPMQAAPVAVLHTVVSSGHEARLGILFTHFDEVKGDNLRGVQAKQDHVTGSFYNAVRAIGKAAGRDAEQSLKALVPDRLFFLSGIQEILPTGSRFTRSELARLLDCVERSIQPPPPVHFYPVYELANLVLAIQNATQEFHDYWRGILGYGTRSGRAPEHWTRVKALTRRIGMMRRDEYDSLRPIADLIRFLQERVSRFLSEPDGWKPANPPADREAEKVQAVDNIRAQVFARLHELSRRRLIDERLSGWVEAYEFRGTGSTRERADELVGLYRSAAPVPNEMPGPDLKEFLNEIRELVTESILEGKGEIRGRTGRADSH